VLVFVISGLIFKTTKSILLIGGFPNIILSFELFKLSFINGTLVILGGHFAEGFRFF